MGGKGFSVCRIDQRKKKKRALSPSRGKRMINYSTSKREDKLFSPELGRIIGLPGKRGRRYCGIKLGKRKRGTSPYSKKGL